MLIDDLNIILSTYDSDSNEYIISRFVIDNWKTINDIKKKTVLSQIGVSISTLSRFVKKLGFKDFTEFKSCIFKEMSSIPAIQNNEKDNINDSLKENLKGVKRIIIIGDKASITPLFVYKNLFYNIGIDLDIKLHFGDTIEVLDKCCLTKNDTVFFISLFQSYLSFAVSHYIDFVEIEDYLCKKGILCTFIGEIDHYLYANSKMKSCVNFQYDSYSMQIYALCQLFENIYNNIKNNKNGIIIK